MQKAGHIPLASGSEFQVRTWGEAESWMIKKVITENREQGGDQKPAHLAFPTVPLLMPRLPGR